MDKKPYVHVSLNPEIVTLKNLHRCYTDQYRNIYVDGEIVDGFNEEEIGWAIKNGCEVICQP